MTIAARDVKFPVRQIKKNKFLPAALARPLGVIVTVVVLQVGFYSISWNQFFCGDSLYYLSRQTYNWSQVRANFLREDDVGQYRPLTYPVFTHVFYPLGDLNPRVYHWAGLVIHILISLAVFGFLRRLFVDSQVALAGYLFFALHCVAYFISYDMTFLADWLFAVFLLLMIACFLKFLQDRHPAFWVMTLVWFVLALLSKETAVMAPFVLLSLCMLQSRTAAECSAGLAGRSAPHLWRAVRDVAPFVSISVVYVLFVTKMKGRLYPELPTHPFHFSLAPSNLVKDHKFLFWAFNVDPRLPKEWVEGLSLLVYLPQIALAAWALLRLARDRQRRWIAGWLLFCAGALLFPVLFLVEPPYPHHLYMPLVALSGMIGLLFLRLPGERPLARRLLVALLCVNLAASYVTIWRFNERSWVAHGSKIARNVLTSLKRHHPTLPPHSVVHLTKTKEPNSIWYFDRHSLLQLFYRDASLSMRFEDIGEKLPPKNGPPIPNYFIYGLWEENLELLPDYWKGQSVELLDWALQGEVGEDRTQYYPQFDEFMTPNGRRVFQHALVRQGEKRNTVVTIAGTRLRIPLPFVEPGSWLHVGLASVNDIGDGFNAMLLIESQGQRKVLIDRYMESARMAADAGWIDYHLDLGRFAGSSNFLILVCDAGPWGRTEADWLAWSMLKIDKQKIR